MIDPVCATPVEALHMSRESPSLLGSVIDTAATSVSWLTVPTLSRATWDRLPAWGASSCQSLCRAQAQAHGLPHAPCRTCRHLPRRRTPAIPGDTPRNPGTSLYLASPPGPRVAPQRTHRYQSLVRH